MLPTCRRLAICFALLGLGALTPAAHAGSFTKETLHFRTVVGPPGGKVRCDVIGDVYVPASASRRNRTAAVMMTNGFGGSKDDQGPLAEELASDGYVVLSYSGLGFGGSGCNISLDDPAYDGLAASQIISFLGGRAGIAYRSHSRARGWSGPVAPFQLVRLDQRAHDGRHYPNDPRMGMYGASYGGGIQFSTAADDPRLDALIPAIAWSDLSYSLDPNNAASLTGPLAAALPGVYKTGWDDLLFKDGTIQPAQHPLTTPIPGSSCPGFDPRVCPERNYAHVHGFINTAGEALLRHASYSNFASRVRAPTLLAQGQADSLFDLRESVVTYNGLRARGVPVAMLWQSWGHSRLKSAPGEFGTPVTPLPGGGSTFAGTYEGQAFLAWFNYYLRDRGPKRAPDFCYFRDWVPYTGVAAPAYDCAPRYPVGHSQLLYLSGDGSLTSSAAAVSAGSQTFTSPAPGATLSFSETPAAELNVPYGSPSTQAPPSDPPGTFAAWTSAPLTSATEVVGIPTVRLHLSAPAVAVAQTADPGTHLVLFAKLYDLAPDGTVTLVHRLVSPVRVPDVGRELEITLPGVVHLYPAGERLQLIIATSDKAYAGNFTQHTAAIVTSPSQPGVLTLPVVSP